MLLLYLRRSKLTVEKHVKIYNELKVIGKATNLNCKLKIDSRQLTEHNYSPGSFSYSSFTRIRENRCDFIYEIFFVLKHMRTKISFNLGAISLLRALQVTC